MKRKIVPIFLITIVFALFAIKSFLYVDPDFGWRIKTGEYILENGIPKKDIFTYTMPSFPFVDHAWSLDVMVAKLYPTVGQLGLAIAAAIFPLLGIWLVMSTRRTQKNGDYLAKVRFSFFRKRFTLSISSLGFFAFAPFLLGVSILLLFAGIRVQVVSWLLFSILISVSMRDEIWQKAKFIAPLIFLLWANVHGSFLAGIVALFLILVLRLFRTKRFVAFDWLIFLACIAATFINPYQSGVWREAWSSASDSKLRWSIVEWMPALMVFDFSMIMFISLSLSLAWRYRRKYQLEEIGLYLFFLAQAILSRRHLPLWVVVAVPFTIEGFYFLSREASKYKFGLERFLILYKITWVASLAAFCVGIVFAIVGASYLNDEEFYPKEAVAYLFDNPPQGEVFSEYGWGGYLVWKMPGRKVFIDGRMPSWRWDSPNDNELDSAFDTYNEIRRGEIEYQEVFDKFGIDTVLWPRPKEKGPIEKFSKKVENVFPFLNNSEDYDFLTDMEGDGWVRVYEDEVSYIYKKTQ